jgi:chaperone modulatory protein CbpM
VKEEMLTLSGTIVEEVAHLTLGELCRTCAIHADAIISMVEEGLLEPQGNRPETWSFPGTAVRRVEVTLRLQKDLQINLAGAALVLDLLEEMQQLRAKIRTLERLVLGVSEERGP